MNSLPQIKVKGLFFKELVKFFTKLNDQKTLDLLKQEFKTQDFSAFKNYPIETDLCFQKIVCQSLFGKENAEGHFVLAEKYYWQVVASSFVTKTIFALAQNDPLKIIPQIVKLNNAFILGLDLSFKIHPQNNEAQVNIKNYPYVPEHYQGIFYGALESLGYKPKVTYDKLSENEYTFILNWKIKS